ncbi:glycosyl hydrolase family 8 [Mesorhizobium sp. SB112]|uniref:glycosyl hydrolase family 8 n=1 Tax=Mesorhizobium sp. SB112 TaxID=3151853 RepID=UPI0032662126
MLGGASAASAQSGTINPADWAAYKSRFIDEGGRVIDDANAHISHSEGQGYGLLLSYLADNRADFDLIWSFTRTEFMLRDDGLAVWKWDPSATPHVTDANNASDGDILIAYALALAGKAWARNDLTSAATSIARATGKISVVENQGRSLLLPGAKGFSADERSDGPIVNLSYWVFEAFPVLAELAPETDWAGLSDEGTQLIVSARLGPKKLPPDWLSLKTRPKPATGFAAEFSYNAIRIPLYLLRAGSRDAALLEPFRAAMTNSGATIDIATGDPRDTLSDAGYRIIPALISCVLEGEKLPIDTKTFAPTLYYPSTLQLLGLSFAAEKHPECLS